MFSRVEEFKGPWIESLLVKGFMAFGLELSARITCLRMVESPGLRLGFMLQELNPKYTKP